MSPETTIKEIEPDFENNSVFCIFCCKQISGKLGLQHEKEQIFPTEDILQRFLKLVSRQINLSTDYVGNYQNLSTACADCRVIVEGYCNLYDEIKCLELRLNWQLEKMENVMTFAGRVPSRYNAFRDWCLTKQENIPSRRETIINFRRDFRKKSKSYRSSMFPRVLLNSQEKVQTNDVITMDSEKHRSTNLETDKNIDNKVENFLGWISSLAALIFLFHLDPENEKRKNDPVTTFSSSVEIQTDEIAKSESHNKFIENEAENNENYDDFEGMSVCSYSENSSHSEDEENTETMEPSILRNILSSVEKSDTKLELTTDVIMDKVRPIISFDGGDEKSEINPICGETNSHEILVASHQQMPVNSCDEAPHQCGDQMGQQLKFEKLAVELPERRSLRKIFKCPTCCGTFSSSKRLDEHTSSCYKASSDNDDEYDNHDGGTDSIGKINTTKNIISSTQPPKVDSQIETEWKVQLESDDQTSSDSDPEDSDEEKTYSEKKPFPSSSGKQKDSVACSMCNAKILQTEPFKYHKGYFHSNGYQSFRKYHLKNIRFEDLKLENFPSNTRHHPCINSDCTEAFSLPSELEMHTKLHHTNETNPTCNFCDLTMDSIINLIDHELEHSVAKEQQNNVDFKKQDRYPCGRCNATTVSKTDFINHYLQTHLNLPPIQATCPICKQNFTNMESVPITHYVNCHDLRRLDDPTKPFRCFHNPEDCSAYFLTEEQLHTHWTRIHQACFDSVEEKTASAERTEQREKKKARGKMVPKTHTCPHCPKVFRHVCKLRIHICQRHTKDLRVIRKADNARDIGKMVISKDGTTINDIVYNKKAKYLCSIDNCKGGFMSEEDLANHSKLHGNFKCDYCPEVKTFAPNLAVHEIVHSVGNKVKNWKRHVNALSCVRCSFITTNRQVYITHHVEKHLGLVIDKRQCPICKHVYKWDMQNQNPKDFKFQVLSHYANYHDMNVLSTDEKEAHKCGRDECQAYFLSSSQLEQHILKIHENVTTSEKCTCPDCGKTFLDPIYLKGHRDRVHGLSVKSLTCDVPECNANFKKNIDLEYHILNVHKSAGKEQLLCPKDNCGKKFWTNTALQAHLRCYEHRGGRPSHICPECGKSFKKNEHLKIHMEYHAGPETWKYSCPICNRKIISKYKLDEHVRTHSKEKPFVCQVCGAAYAQRHNLRIHINNKHEVKDIPRTYNKADNMPSSRKGRKFK